MKQRPGISVLATSSARLGTARPIPTTRAAPSATMRKAPGCCSATRTPASASADTGRPPCRAIVANRHTVIAASRSARRAPRTSSSATITPPTSHTLQNAAAVFLWLSRHFLCLPLRDLCLGHRRPPPAARRAWCGDRRCIAGRCAGCRPRRGAVWLPRPLPHHYRAPYRVPYRVGCRVGRQEDPPAALAGLLHGVQVRRSTRSRTARSLTPRRRATSVTECRWLPLTTAPPTASTTTRGRSIAPPTVRYNARHDDR